jgi:RimJ/RimL family protein N-acetyltransferase
MQETSTSQYILETERLRLRRFTLDDSGFILALLNSAGWLRFIGDRNVRTVEEARQYLENGPLKSYATNGYGLSLVEKKDDGEAIGMCGFLKRDTLDSPDIGFAFLPDFTGKGYALEIADAVLKHAKEKLGLSEIAAITLPDNVRSIRLLEKIGLTYQQKISFAGNELVLYSNYTRTGTRTSNPQ